MFILIYSVWLISREAGKLAHVIAYEFCESQEQDDTDKFFSTEYGKSEKENITGKRFTKLLLVPLSLLFMFVVIEKVTFEQFHRNPEEFIIKATNLINDQKVTVIIEHITYNKLDDSYSTDIFTEPTLKGKLGVNALKADRHLYDHILYDSTNEKKFAEELDKCNEVAVYVKLPNRFYINTPVGKYNPDWAIAFHEGKVKHIYFVAETKGDLSTMQLRKVEELKIHCAREHPLVKFSCKS